MITLGLDVGGTFLKSVVVDDNKVVEQSTERLPSTGVFDHVSASARRLVIESAAEAVGVGLAGLVKWPEGEFVWGPHMADGTAPVRGTLEKELRLPVVVDNDANLAAYGEWAAGAATGARSVLLLMFGTGIGAGLVIDGAVYHGRSFAGEVGHMTLDVGGDVCACGRRGCWETLISGEVLDRRAAELAARAPDGRLARIAGDGRADAACLTRAAQQGDVAARALLAEGGSWLGRGLANLALLLDPEVVVVGGAVALAGSWLLDPARTAIASHLSGSSHRPQVRVVEARHGRLAGAVGAALLARDTSGK